MAYSETSSLPKPNKKTLLKKILLALVFSGFFVFSFFLLTDYLNSFLTRSNNSFSNNNEHSGKNEKNGISSPNQNLPQIVKGWQTESSDISQDISDQLQKISKEIQTLKSSTDIAYLKKKLDLTGAKIEVEGDMEIGENLIVNATSKTESIIPKADDNYNLGSEDKGWDNAYIHQLYGSSILTVGNNVTNHALSKNYDLLISGNLEVDGDTYFDGDMVIAGNTYLGGSLDLGSYQIQNLLDPQTNQDAATKYYVDSQLGASAIALGTTAQYYRGDKTWATLNQAVISGLTISDSPTFAGLTLSGILNMGNNAIQNIGAAGTDFSGTGGLTLADALVVLGGGIDVTGASTFYSGLTISGLLGIAGDTTLVGNLDITGNIAVANTQAPTLSCSYSGESGQDVYVVGEVAYFLQGNNTAGVAGGRLTMIDINDCSVLGYYRHPTMTFSHSMIHHNGYLLITNVGDGRHGITVLDIKSGINPSFVTFIGMDKTFTGKPVQVMGGDVLAVGLGRPDGIAFWDISDITHPKFLTSVADTGTNCTGDDGPTSCFRAVQTLWCDDDSYWCIAGNSSQSTNSVASIYLQRKASGTAIAYIADILEDTSFKYPVSDFTEGDDEYVYFPLCSPSGDNPELAIINHKNKWALEKAGTFEAGYVGCMDGVAKSSDTLYMADEQHNSSLVAVDISDKTSPALKYSFGTLTNDFGYHTMKILGEKLFAITQKATTNQGTLDIYDVNAFKVDHAKIGSLRTTRLRVDDRIESGSIDSRGYISSSGGITTSGSLAAGNGFTVIGANQFSGTPSLSYNETVANPTINSMGAFENKIYALSSNNAQVAYYPAVTAGNVWDTFNLNTIQGSGAFSTAMSVCEIRTVQYIGMGASAGDGQFAYCTGNCDANGDYYNTGLSGGTAESGDVCLGMDSYGYFGRGTTAGDGDVYVCTLGLNTPGNDTICDDAADFAISLDSSASTKVYDLEIHSGSLYACRSGGGSDNPIMYCDPGADDKCSSGEWNESWQYNALAETDCFDLLSAGGCLYSIMANMDIYRCCATDGICETDNGDWSLVVDSAGGGYGKMLYVNGKLIYGGQAAGGIDLMQLDTLGETSQAKESVLWDHSYRGTFPYLFKDGAMWLGIYSDSSAQADVFTWPLDTGMITDYRGNTTAGNGVSSIVGYVSQTGKTENISEANIVVPPADGLYRISVTQQVTVAGSTGNITTTARYTDATNTARTVATGALNCNAVGTNTTSQIIQAQAVDPISYDATEGSSCDGTWATYIIVERLN